MDDSKQGVKIGQADTNNFQNNSHSHEINLPNDSEGFSGKETLLSSPEKKFTKYSPSHSDKSLISLLDIEKTTLIVDNIVESLHFTGFHMATLFVCIFSMICDGYLVFHFKMGQKLMIKRFMWTDVEVNRLYSLQLSCMALGSLVSQNVKTTHWDVSSNILLGTIGCLCLLMISFYSEAMTYSFMLLVFCICHGFIQDICTNYLVELVNIRLRGFLFLLVSSFRILGTIFSTSVFIYLYGSYGVDEPSLLLLSMIAFQLGLTISLIYLLDSPRVLFYNGELSHMYEYIQVMTTEHRDPIYNQQFKAQIISKLDSARKDIDYNYGHLKSEGFMKGYKDLFVKPHLKITLRAGAFIFFIAIFMTMITNSHEYFYRYYSLDMSPYLFSLNNISRPNALGERDVNYGLYIYYTSEFIILISLCYSYYLLPNVKRIYFNLSALTVCGITMICILSIKSNFVYFICVFESFSYFYLLLIYLYCTENTTTQLRNYLTGVMMSTLMFTNIAQNYFVPFISKINPHIAVYINFGVLSVLVLMEYFTINNKRDSKDMNLQEIELNILKKN
jgi:hypothetical protein